MKKAIVEFNLKDDLIRLFNWEQFFTQIESLELLEILKLDFEKSLKIIITKIILKEGININDLVMPTGGEILSVIKSDKNQHICLVKGQPPLEKFKDIQKISKGFNIDVIWTTPTIFSEEKMAISVIGDEENIKKFYNLWKKLADITKISFQPANFEISDLISCLTDKQKEIIIKAKKHGYYNYPRKINSEKLAKSFGISKATTIEHLRKAENRLIDTIFTGY